MTEEQDKIKLEGVLSKGYGIIPKLVMIDADLTIEAKAIYAYLASYAGNGESAFPSVKKMCYDLQINEKRFSRHKKALLDKGYIEVTQERKGGSFASNIYTIKQFVQPTTQNGGTVPSPQNGSTQIGSTQIGSTQNGSSQNGGTNNNSVTNNSSINNNSINNQQQPASSEPTKINFIQTWEQCGFGIIPPITMQKLDDWVKDFDDNEEIICKAIEVATDNNVRRYAYVEKILKSWEDRGVKSLEDIEALENQRQKEIEEKKNKAAAPKQKYGKKPVRKESKPDWAKPGYVQPEETALTVEVEFPITVRLFNLSSTHDKAEKTQQKIIDKFNQTHGEGMFEELVRKQGLVKVDGKLVKKDAS